ncbi:MAG: alanyl-tRNA editing protein [Spirochaetes bacterium]|nr:alanyl-tRNA editing protein [Spirochaetota bacterium]MBU1082022.1 alanyl-tRNA editing protein [Spirochaetota bacterium]
MSTIKLYYEEPGTEEADSAVVRAIDGGDGRFSLVLDSTIFYPEGGGQPCDLGTIAGLPVESVIEEGDDVAHVVVASRASLAEAGVEVGASVRCRVDLRRRLDHSEQHTAQHLLSSVILRLLGATTLSFHLGERYSSIDIDRAPPERADVDAVEDEVMRIVSDDYAVVTHLCPPEDPAGFPLRKRPSVGTGQLRVVEIDGLEYSACCGTHVQSSGALGLFRVTKVEKYKSGCRVYFVAGRRAFADYRRLAGLARDCSAAAGAPEDELPRAIVALKDRVRYGDRSLEEARDAIAGYEASALDGATPPGEVVFAEARDFETASGLVRALARLGRVSLAASRAELKVAAGSPPQPDAGAKPVDLLFGPAAKARGGKGGGGRTFFQAAFADSAALDAFLSDCRLP